MATIVTNGSGRASGGGSDDIFELTAARGRGQIHSYDQGGSDTLHLWFDPSSPINIFSYGHHVRAGEEGNDLFIFDKFSTVSSTIVGRIEDFDASHDQIQVGETLLDLTGGTPLPSNVKIVEWDTENNDTPDYTQQWLLIDTGPGLIFYALEGARIDMNGQGGANLDQETGEYVQERHFMNADPNIDFASIQSVDFIDQQNYVPVGYSASNSGVVINDEDKTIEDVLEVIVGSSYIDTIAGGLNDDTIVGLGGNDKLWGGSGHDNVQGNDGNDHIWGGTGNDIALGGDGNDQLRMGHGDDTARGQQNNDKLYGFEGNDRMYGGQGEDQIYGENGEDWLAGGQDEDLINGGNGRDTLRGGSGDDTIYGGSSGDQIYDGQGDDYVDGGSGWDYFYSGAGDDVWKSGGGRDKFVFRDDFGHDTITDFNSHNYEKIDFREIAEITSFSDLVNNHLSNNSSGTAVITVGDDTITLNGYTENGIANGSQGITADDFWFT